MTILFAGTEREAISDDGAHTGFAEAASGYRVGYGRGSSHWNAASSYYEVVFDAEQTELWVHCTLAYGGFGDADGAQIALMDAADNVIVRLLGTNPNFVVQYWNGAAFVSLGTIAKAFSQGAWDIHVVKAGAASIVAGYFEAALVGSVGSPVDLSAYGGIKKVRFYRAAYGENALSELVITNDESTLQWGVFTRPPSADGIDTDGTGVVGDFNELVLDDGAFLELANAGDKRSVVHAALAAENFIRGVAVAGRLRRVDDTGPQQARPYLIIGGARYYGTTFSLTTSFENYEFVWNLSPASGTDWTTAEVNDAEFEMGWEAVA